MPRRLTDDGAGSVRFGEIAWDHGAGSAGGQSAQAGRPWHGYHFDSAERAAVRALRNVRLHRSLPPGPVMWVVGDVRSPVRQGGHQDRREGPPWLEWRILVLMKPARAGSRRFLPGSPFNARPADPPAEQFTVHDQVTHDKYGLGRVVLVEDDEAVVVDFGSHRVRILSPFAKLTRL